MSISRRNLIIATALAGGGSVLSLEKGVAETPADTRQPENAHFHRLQLGDFEITVLSDGRRAGEQPEKTYAIDQKPEDVAVLLEDNLLPADRFVNSFTPLLINTGSELILFDTGLGAAARETGQGQMMAAMKASGFAPEDVTIVVLSHFHPDHIGGLMEDGQPAFTNARYYAGQQEFDFWTDPARMDSPAARVAQMVQSNVKPLADKMTFLADGDEIVPGINALAAFGHTPGHLIFRVESDGKQLILISDTANHFVMTLQRPDWHVSFDMDKEQAVETRKRVLDMIATERLPFIGYHMPFPSVGYLKRSGEGYEFIPETYQLRDS